MHLFHYLNDVLVRITLYGGWYLGIKIFQDRLNGDKSFTFPGKLFVSTTLVTRIFMTNVAGTWRDNL